MAVGCSVSIRTAGPNTRGGSAQAERGRRSQAQKQRVKKSGGVMISIENVSRRGFLKGMVGAGAFVLGVRLMPGDLLASGDVGGVDPSASMNAAPLHPS